MDKIAKFLKMLNKKQRGIFLAIFNDLLVLNLSEYDVKQLKGLPGVFRIRKGDIRVVFVKKEGRGVIIDIGFRKAIYKNL